MNGFGLFVNSIGQGHVAMMKCCTAASASSLATARYVESLGTDGAACTVARLGDSPRIEEDRHRRTMDVGADGSVGFGLPQQTIEFRKDPALGGSFLFRPHRALTVCVFASYRLGSRPRANLSCAVATKSPARATITESGTIGSVACRRLTPGKLLVACTDGRTMTSEA